MEPREGCSPIQQGHLQEREPRAEPRQLSNDSISYTDGSKWHPEISTHSLSMHYICSPYFCYCVVMVMHKCACKDTVKAVLFFLEIFCNACRHVNHLKVNKMPLCVRVLTHLQAIFYLFHLNTTNYCDFQRKHSWSCTSIWQLQETTWKIKKRICASLRARWCKVTGVFIKAFVSYRNATV